MTDQEQEGRLLDLAQKVYDKKASAEEETEFLRLLNALIVDLKQDLDKSKVK